MDAASGQVDPAIDMKTAVRAQVNALSGVEYFRLLAELLKANPPAAADAPILPKLAQIGIVPGKDFDLSAADPAVLNRVPKIAFDRIMLHFVTGPEIENINGWRYTTKTGLYGTDYVQRALIRPSAWRQPAGRRGLSDIDEGGERSAGAQI